MRLSQLTNFPYLEKPLRQAAIICHRHADVDAYCSSHATVSLLRQIYPKAKIETSSPRGFSTLAKRIQEEYPMKIVEVPDFRKADLIVVVDTGHASLLEDWVEQIKTSKSVRVLIDHHPYSKSFKCLADHAILDRRVTSTCEIIYHIFRAKNVRITKKTAQMIMLGILCDSQHLNIAKCNTLDVMNKLCTIGASLENAKRILTLRRETSENIARLKAAQRLEIYRAGRWIIAATNIGSYNASAARALIDLGADVSFALGENDAEVRGCLRATQEFCTETGVHFGLEIAEKMGILFNGTGGGHSGAASFTVSVSLSESRKTVLKLLGQKLKLELQKVV